MFRFILHVSIVAGVLSRDLSGVTREQKGLKDSTKEQGNTGLTCADCSDTENGQLDTDHDTSGGGLSISTRISHIDHEREHKAPTQHLPAHQTHASRRHHGHRLSHKQPTFLRLRRIRIKVNRQLKTEFAKENHFLNGTKVKLKDISDRLDFKTNLNEDTVIVNEDISAVGKGNNDISADGTVQTKQQVYSGREINTETDVVYINKPSKIDANRENRLSIDNTAKSTEISKSGDTKTEQNANEETLLIPKDFENGDNAEVKNDTHNKQNGFKLKEKVPMVRHGSNHKQPTGASDQTRHTHPKKKTIIKSNGQKTIKSTHVHNLRKGNTKLPEDNDEAGDRHVKSDDNRSAYNRWNRPGLRPLPGVLRLEQRLHPRIEGPARDIRRAMDEILSKFSWTLRKVDRDYRYMFNMTRLDIMIGVRHELTKLAKANDEAYDAVIEASLLTKQIYYRAHQARRYGNRPSQVVAAAAHGISMSANMHALDLAPYRTAVNEELNRATDLKSKIERMARVRDRVVSELMRLQQVIAQRLSPRILHDLLRYINRVLDLLNMHSDLLFTGNGEQLLTHMRNDSSLSMYQSFKKIRSAEVALRQGRENLLVNQNLRRSIIDMDKRKPEPISRPYNGDRVEEWAYVDKATYRAEELVMQVAKLHMLLNPLITRGKDHMNRSPGDRTHSEMEHQASVISKDIKTLTSVQEQIGKFLGYKPPVTKRPCVQTEGSGAGEWTSDSEDCDDDVDTPEGSGEIIIDDTEGSGEVHIEEEKVDVDLTNVPIEPVTDDIDNVVTFDGEEIFIDDEDDELSSMPSGDGPILSPSTPSPSLSSNSVPSSSKTSPIPTSKQSPTPPSKQSQTPSSKQSPTPSYKQSPEPSSKQSPTPSSKQSPPSSKQSPTSLSKQSSTSSSSVPTTSTTTILPTASLTKSSPTTTQQSTIATTLSFWDSFGLFNDQPADMINNNAETGSDMKEHKTLNELIRERLSNLSQTGRALRDPALMVQDSVTELGETYHKLVNRVDAVEGRTKAARTILHEANALMASYRAVHQRVEEVVKDIDRKEPLITKQLSRAEEVADRKVKVMEEALKARAGRQTDAPDQSVVIEFREAMNQVRSNMAEISQLSHVTADPCTRVQMFDVQFRTNISDLRKKVQQAKLIATSLPIAVSTKGKGHLKLSLPDRPDTDHSLTTTVEATFSPSSDDGPVVTVKAKDTGSIMFAIEDMKPKLSVIDDDDDEIAVQNGETSLVPGTWYKLVMSRMTKSFNVSIFDAAIDSLVDMVTLVPEADIPISQPFPSTLFVAGVSSQFPKYGSRSWSGCVGDVTVNGERLYLLTNDSKSTMPNVCTSVRDVSHSPDSWIFDGTGYVYFPLTSVLTTGSRLQSISVKFNARSDGLLLNLQTDFTARGTRIVVRVSNGHVEVLVRHAKSRTSHVSKKHVLGMEHIVEVRLDGRKTSIVLNNNPNDIEAQPSVPALNMTTDLQGLYIGGTINNDSSILGCIHGLTVNQKQVKFESLSRGSGVRQGFCPDTLCYMYTNNSSPLVMTSLNGSTFSITFTKGSLGQILQLSRGEKFMLSVVLNSEGVEFEEFVKEESESIDLDDYKPGNSVTLVITDDPDKEEIKVSIKDEVNEISYDSSTGFWTTKEKGPRGPSTYDMTVGDTGFTGSIMDIGVDYKSLDLSEYAESNMLPRCGVDTFSRVKPSTTTRYSPPVIEMRNVCDGTTDTP